MGKGKGHIPIRTCISCGAKRGKKELIRLVVNGEGRLVRDDLETGQGRGAYICNIKSCFEQLSRNKRLNRAFRTKERISISPDFKINPNVA